MKKLISETGWTKEDWIEHLSDFALVAVFCAGFILPGLLG